VVQSHRYRGLWPPNWNLKHYKLVDFCQIWMSNPPCKKVNPPHTNVKSPYWRLFGDGFVVVLIWLSKHTRKDLQIIIAFVHSAFITPKSLFAPTNMVLKRYLPCRTFNKCPNVSHTAMGAVYTYVHTLEADNQLHNCVCEALSIKDGGVINIITKSLRKRTIELQLLWWFYIIM